MKVYSTLLKKEFVGLWRSKKFIWLPIVFMLLSIMQPLTMYFMEDILKMGGGLPEGTIIEMPLPSGGEVLASILSQLNTIGLLLVVVATMGAISDERRNGSLTLLFVRPISAIKLVCSKTVSHGFLLVLSFICGYLLAYYYTNLLFSTVSIGAFGWSMLIYSIYILFIVSCVVFSSALLTSNGAIAISNVLFFSALSLVSSWLNDALQWSPTQLSSNAISLVMTNGESKGLIGSVIVTIICILILHVAAAIIVRKKNT